MSESEGEKRLVAKGLAFIHSSAFVLRNQFLHNLSGDPVGPERSLVGHSPILGFSSSMARMRSAGRSVHVWISPEGQRISSRSTVAALPRPNLSRGAWAER